MAKTYWFTFSTQDPRTYTGLAPTFVQFVNQLGQTLAPPGITESPVGFGFYRSDYTVGLSTSIAFLVDGGATLSSSIRYITGNIFEQNSLDTIGQTLTAIGNSAATSNLVALIGSTVASFGSTSVDPSTIFGYLRRSQEVQEGNQTFLKSTGEWDILSRGSSTLLATKFLNSDVSGVTRI